MTKIYEIKKKVRAILLYGLMLPLCKPSFAEVARTTQKVERACLNNI